VARSTSGLLDSVRGSDAFVIQSHSYPVDEMLMEELVMIDALKRASVGHLTAVIPYLGYSRQDQKSLEREPISARLVADMRDHRGRGPGDGSLLVDNASSTR